MKLGGGQWVELEGGVCVGGHCSLHSPESKLQLTGKTSIAHVLHWHFSPSVKGLVDTL